MSTCLESTSGPLFRSLMQLFQEVTDSRQLSGRKFHLRARLLRSENSERIPFTIIDLINSGVLDYNIAAYAWLLIENRFTAVVVGATASGKTTFLNALLSMVNPNSKIVTIEEVQEINIHHVNWAALVSRLSYGLSETNIGEVTLFNLVKTAMRMRPDIMVVGEVRGEEAYALFQAISTGHGGLATLHAEDAASAIQRLTSKPMDVAPSYISFLDLIFSVRRVAIQTQEIRVPKNSQKSHLCGRSGKREQIYSVFLMGTMERTNSMISWKTASS